MKSVVTPEWHYVEGGKLGEELYMCCGSEFPGEDLARIPTGSTVAAELKQTLDEGRPDAASLSQNESRSGNGVPSGGLAILNSGLTRDSAAKRKRMNEQLRALGYVH